MASTLWLETEALAWHPDLPGDRVRDAWSAAEGWVAKRCRWPETEMPADLKLAVKLLTARFLARHNSPDGLVGGASELGPVRVSGGDRDVDALVGPWRKVVV